MSLVNTHVYLATLLLRFIKATVRICLLNVLLFARNVLLDRLCNRPGWPHTVRPPVRSATSLAAPEDTSSALMDSAWVGIYRG